MYVFLNNNVKAMQFNPKYKLRRAPCGLGPYTAARTLLSVNGSVHVAAGAPWREHSNPLILVNLIVRWIIAACENNCCSVFYFLRLRTHAVQCYMF